MRPTITDTTPFECYKYDRSAVFGLSGQGETESCFFEYCFYDQSADVVRSR